MHKSDLFYCGNRRTNPWRPMRYFRSNLPFDQLTNTLSYNTYNSTSKSHQDHRLRFLRHRAITGMPEQGVRYSVTKSSQRAVNGGSRVSDDVKAGSDWLWYFHVNRWSCWRSSIRGRGQGQIERRASALLRFKPELAVVPLYKFAADEEP